MTLLSRSDVHVLLVEDDPGDVLLIREAFELYRIRNPLHRVPDGEEAMQFLRRRAGFVHAPRPGVVLLDLNLPKRSGHEVLREIKNDNLLRRIPVVVLTTSSLDEDILRSYDTHANAYVTKPSDLTDFSAVIQKISEFFTATASLPQD